MEKLVTNVIGTRPNGTKIVRNHFINGPTENLLVKSHSHFTREERTKAKLKHKAETNGR